MVEGEETAAAAMATRAATPAASPTLLTVIRRSEAHLWLYAVISGALMLLIVGYVFLASYSIEGAVLTTSGNVQGTNSTLRTTENRSFFSPSSLASPSLTHIMTNFITSSAAEMLNKNVCWGERGLGR